MAATSSLRDLLTLSSGASRVGGEEVPDSRAGATRAGQRCRAAPQHEMGPGLSVKTHPPRSAPPFLASPPLSLSPGSQRGADGSCQQLLRVTDGELGVGWGRKGVGGGRVLARPPVKPQAGSSGGCDVPSP